jgi:protein-export membrane protein SecD
LDSPDEPENDNENMENQSQVSFFSRFYKGFIQSITHPSDRDKLRWVVIGILLLSFFAGALDYPAIWNKSADGGNYLLNKVPAFQSVKIPYFWNLPYHLGLDLQGGTHLVYEADMKDVPDADRSESLEGARDVIERRVNAYGVAEPLVQTSQTGNIWRIIVELAGVKDISQAIKMIGETPILEFKEQDDSGAQTAVPTSGFKPTAEQISAMNEVNAQSLEKAKEAFQKVLAEGADFSEIVKEYTNDLNKGYVGDVGIVGVRSQYEPVVLAIDEANLQNGQILNQIVENSEGYNVVKLLDTSGNANERDWKASHILICYKDTVGCTTETTKEEARRKINELKSKATPENFAQLAKENSTEPGADASGGYLGWFTKGMMVAPFENGVKATRVGTISNIVETQYGFHIIYKMTERPAKNYRIERIIFPKISESDFDPALAMGSWKSTGLTGKQLKRSELQFDPNTNDAQVGLEFNSEGAQLFAEITARNVGKPVAIFLDGLPISTPTVQQEISDGKAVITGNFSLEEAKLLVRRLNSGALPVPINLISQQTVGATLGRDSLNKSLIAGLIGFALVILFMILYYRVQGLIAAITLIFYASAVIAIFKLLSVTLTLSGIAGFILSLGMAVDANVLIFERAKEELKRGKLLSRAIEEGFKRAWTSIRDGNLTTLLSCLILFWFSESMIKGFALTLGIGVLVSMISAITVTRMLLRYVEPWIKNIWWFGVKNK